MDELESKKNTRRAQGGLGLLSHTFSVQKLNNPWLKSLTLERRGKGQEGGGGRQEERAAFCPGKRERREGEGVFNPNNSQPKRLNYP